MFSVDEKGDTGADISLHNTTKAFSKDVHKVIGSSDVVIEVLDARDPQGTR